MKAYACGKEIHVCGGEQCQAESQEAGFAGGCRMCWTKEADGDAERGRWELYLTRARKLELVKRPKTPRTVKPLMITESQQLWKSKTIKERNERMMTY